MVESPRLVLPVPHDQKDLPQLIKKEFKLNSKVQKEKLTGVNMK